MVSSDDELFIQEACLGRVKLRRGKKICYLIKWAGWDTVKDITCEPPNKVLVEKVEEPLLEQSAVTFEEELKRLLAAYLERPRPPVEPEESPPPHGGSEAKKEGAQERSRKVKAEATDGAPPVKKAKARSTKYTVEAASAPSSSANAEQDACTNGPTYCVNHRQFFLVPETSVCREGALAAVFLNVDRATMNPGVGWTIQANLRCAGAHPDHGFLGGSVDGLSNNVGFGWFYHELSGVSLEGRRQVDHTKYNSLRFTQGDSVGIVVDLEKNVGYCARNGSTVFRVEFASCVSQPMVFAIHLCEKDQVTVCTPSQKLQAFVTDTVPLVLAPESSVPGR